MSIVFNGKTMDFSQVFIPKTFIKTCYDLNFHMDFHAHTNVEIAYIESGKIEISEMNGPTFSCGAKQFILIKKNQYHKLIPKSDDIRLLVLEISSPDKNLPIDEYIATSPEFSPFHSLRKIMSSKYAVSIFSDTSDVGTVLLRLLELLNAREENIENEFFELEYEIFIKRLLISICQCRNKHLKIFASIHINHAIEFISDNYSQDIKSSDVAQFIGVTPSYAQKILRAATGMTIMKIVNFYRMKQSEFLIATTRLSFHEIAQVVGFKNEANLYKNFYSVHGCSPSDYKNKKIKAESFYHFDKFEIAKSLSAPSCR